MMPEKSHKILLSDADSLRRIKFAQFRSQVPALALLAIAIALNALVPSHNLYSVALVLALVAVVWYLIVGFSFRFRQKIAAPPANALLSPIQGRIAFSRGNEDVTLLNIRKVLLDRVEIRCPHDSSRLEDGILHLDSVAGKISFRFDFRRLQWFPDVEFKAGNIIGIAIGKGGCTVTFPGQPKLICQTGDQVDAGDVLMEDLVTGQTTLQDEKSRILEVIPDLPEGKDEL